MARAPTCTCGSCRKCKHRAYMRSYYARPENAEKKRQAARAYRASNLDETRAYDRGRNAVRKKALDPVKRRARQYIANAVYHGRLTREPCEVCGAPDAEAHHEDYGRPKDVRWLCRTHHMERHRTAAA